MTRRHSSFKAAAALALAAALAACGAPQASPQTTTQGTAPPSSATASATPTPTPTPTPTENLATFSFTTQKLSLRYPSGWIVDAKTYAGMGGTGESAAFKDASGKPVVTVQINSGAYDVGWPVQRTVIESGALPGLAAGGFAGYQYAYFAEVPQPAGGPGTVCWLRISSQVPSDGAGVAGGLPPGGPVPVGPGAVQPPYFITVWLGGEDLNKCGSVDNAKAWWASKEGQQVRSAVLSLTAG
ncbi:hypothetical protein RBS60_17195 [Sinomonas sp. ASV486]|uniref:hypothetical protein n=1 Tax=Sinomonas sp. ASV486 TaxID=3051170 RepID=UPI0027DDC70F|nr:hypothetical protein [Sinomonas sp. ASV486]MDQ4491939.1 hypothetical protein [Sinomonas sp. ASV486]